MSWKFWKISPLEVVRCPLICPKRNRDAIIHLNIQNHLHPLTTFSNEVPWTFSVAASIFPMKLFILSTQFPRLLYPLVSIYFNMITLCFRFGQLQTVDLQSMEPSIRAGDRQSFCNLFVVLLPPYHNTCNSLQRYYPF